MAFTEKQKRHVFQILEMPFSTSFNTVEPIGTLSAQTTINNVTGQAKTQVETFLAAMDVDDEVELKIYLDRWEIIKLRTARIDAGAVGDVQGISRDPNEERALIAKYVKVMVPFFKQHEVLEKRHAAGGITIPLIR